MSFVSTADHRDPRKAEPVVPIGPLAAGSMPAEGTAFEPHSPVDEERPLIAAGAWEQLDRWADEGGAIRAVRAQAASKMDKGVSAMLAILETDDLKAVRELERLRIEATRQNDADVLAPLLDEQLIYVNSAGAVFDKEHYLQSIRTHELTYDRDFDVRETEVRVLDDVIVLAGVMLGHSRLDGEQQVFHFPCIGVWRKDSGEWRMLAWQSSSGSMAF
jgi:SHS2 domain-containing protein